jgi:threonine dehydrogenase-like Zn-dependent dehydrogenase
LAAALRIPQQIPIKKKEHVLVLGDGKLGLLVAQVMRHCSEHVWCSGKHERKLSFLKDKGIQAWSKGKDSKPFFELVVDATGNPESLEQALRLLKPGGRLVLKSTYHDEPSVNISKIVIDEIQIIGSRCGPFSDAIEILRKKLIDVEGLVGGDFPLFRWAEALRLAGQPGVVKVLLTP